jgi:hypothetical protein
MLHQPENALHRETQSWVRTSIPIMTWQLYRPLESFNERAPNNYNHPPHCYDPTLRQHLAAVRALMRLSPHPNYNISIRVAFSNS